MSFLNAVGAFLLVTISACIWLGLIYLIGRVVLRHVQGWQNRAGVVAVALLMARSVVDNVVAALGGLFR